MPLTESDEIRIRQFIQKMKYGLIPGMKVFITYHDNSLGTLPSNPTGDGTTGGWHREPTEASNWMSVKTALKDTIGTWGTPITVFGLQGTDKVERFAGNTGLGQSYPAYVNYAPEATIAGVRTNDTTFTRDAGTWVVDALIGQYVYSYAIADPDAGSWLLITDNAATTITVSGVLFAACDRVITSIWNPMQNEYTHGKGNNAFYGGVFDGESIWMAPFNSDDLIKVNPSDGSITSYVHGKGDSAFAGGIFDGESVWLVPFNSDDLIKVNPSDGSMTSYAHGEGATAFSGGVFDGKFIWLIPFSSDNLVKVNPSDGSMTSYAHGKGNNAFVGGVFDGEFIWLVPSNSDDLVKVNPSDGSMISYAHGLGDSAFRGGVFDGESVWLIPYNSNDLVKVTPSDGSMISYAHGKGGAAFYGGVFDGESVWLIPYNSNDLVKVNPSDGSMISYAHGLGDVAFAGGIFDGESVWLVPHNYDEIVSFIPPRFGRPSLHTTGPLNVGGALRASGEIRVRNTATQLILEYDDVNSVEFLVGATGDLIILSYGDDIGTASNISSSKTIQAEHFTSTDDITMQGHLLTLGNAGSAADVVILCLSSGNSGSIKYDQSEDEFLFGDANVKITGTLEAGILSDGIASITGGDFSGVDAIVSGGLIITAPTTSDVKIGGYGLRTMYFEGQAAGNSMAIDLFTKSGDATSSCTWSLFAKGTLALHTDYEKLIIGYLSGNATMIIASLAGTGETTHPIVIYTTGNTDQLRLNADGKVGIGLASPKTKLTIEGALTLREQPAADGDSATYGQLWVKTATPNELWFTDDGGTDHQIAFV